MLRLKFFFPVIIFGPRSWMPILFAALASCTTSHDIWQKYETGGQHRAYAIGSKGAAGAVWNYPAAEEAVNAARELCTREGGVDCRVTHLNGKPYFATSLEESEKILAMDETGPELQQEAASTTETNVEVVEEVLPALPLVVGAVDALAEVPTGSGFLVSAAGHIITNAPIVEDCVAIRARYQGKTIKASLVRVDRHNGLALLQGEFDVHKAAQLETNRVPRPGEPVYAFGYPSSSELNSSMRVTAGTLSAAEGLNGDSRYFQVSISKMSGINGGPLIDQYGRVIGMVVSSRDDSDANEVSGTLLPGVSLVIKAPVIKVFLDSSQVTISQSGQGAGSMPLSTIQTSASLIAVQVGCYD